MRPFSISFLKLVIKSDNGMKREGKERQTDRHDANPVCQLHVKILNQIVSIQFDCLLKG